MPPTLPAALPHVDLSLPQAQLVLSTYRLAEEALSRYNATPLDRLAAEAAGRQKDSPMSRFSCSTS